MDHCADFMSSLYRKGVKLWLDDDKLHYRAGKGILTTEDTAALRRMKEEIIRVLKQRRSATIESSDFALQKTIDLAPLTVQQESIWRGIQLGGLSYLNPFVLRISGPLNTEILRRSFEEIVRRHGSLRTRVVLLDGVPKQRIDEPQEYPLKVVNCSTMPQAEVDAQVQDLVDEVCNQDCDMAVGPLFQTRLIRLKDDEHLLIWSIHHIVSDGFSCRLMFRELWLSYSELVQERPSPLQTPAMQYANYAIWQREAQRTSMQSQELYWQQRLNGAAAIRWPVDKCESTMNRHPSDWNSMGIRFSQESNDGLRKSAARAGTTLAMAILAVYVASVSRLCNQSDFVVSISVTGRDRPGLQSMAGYVAHGLYLRIQLGGHETLADLLQQVTQEFSQALLHQDFGRTAAGSSDLRANALFQWMPWRFDEADGVPEPDVSPKLDIKVERLPTKVALKKRSPFQTTYKCDIMTLFADAAESIDGGFGYRPSAFAANMGERFASILRSTGNQLARTPYSRVADRS